jgi:hypothetical protein
MYAGVGNVENEIDETRYFLNELKNYLFGEKKLNRLFLI